MLLANWTLCCELKNCIKAITSRRRQFHRSSGMQYCGIKEHIEEMTTKHKILQEPRLRTVENNKKPIEQSFWEVTFLSCGNGVRRVTWYLFCFPFIFMIYTISFHTLLLKACNFVWHFWRKSRWIFIYTDVNFSYLYADYIVLVAERSNNYKLIF